MVNICLATSRTLRGIGQTGRKKSGARKGLTKRTKKKKGRMIFRPRHPSFGKKEKARDFILKHPDCLIKIIFLRRSGAAVRSGIKCGFVIMNKF